MSPSFLEIPDLPMEMIMNYLDYNAIQSVRKTCWDLRNFIDDKKLGINMTEIDISETSDTEVGLAIKLLSSYINLYYEKHENGCRISGGTSGGHKNKIVENLNFLDAALHDFKIAINSQRLIFEKVTVTVNTFFEKFEEMMKSQKPFATESIEIHADSQDQARQILHHADPKYLKSIDINAHEYEFIDGGNIIETVKLQSSGNIQNFSHFSLASIRLENIDVETLRALKENFLQLHEYDKYLYVDDTCRENLFVDAFGAAFVPHGETEQNWFFNVPGNKEKVLKVFNKWRCFEFLFIEKCEVPEGCVIRD
ncbi:hypothetical protein GCK72_021369 [Caenorhabditis remanei]|uniref:F-box domain-containing protein n=1 Tax=Caenorhabditis remanei TaxID=31234 RepID=A0A6A5GJR4_CAERE|nr:hypothetical protein GCK72_021369 [Caenorhabditis remanei]KAF1754805.1 hypothetical protein GCK72_021369 [Caenorhabditis remanei]